MGLYEIARLPAIQSIKGGDGMIKNSENESTVDLNNIEKKAWREPHISKLNVKETKSGSITWATEFDWGFISGGPS